MNICFSYEYRDAGNYKSWGSVIFQNDGDLELDGVRERLERAFDSGCFFIARQVGVPDLFFDGPLTEDDHCFHAFDSLELTDESPTDSRSLSEFVAIVESQASTGWKAFERR